MASGTHSPGGPNGIIRSQSFAGFSTLQERRSRCNSFMGNAVVQKKPQSKPKKPHLSGHKGSSGSRDPQPKRLEEVYTALKQGLDEYLEVHQTELDKLLSHMKDMRRNSRLGVLYDLDKQIKTIERYMRRLEFHMSKVDELYEDELAFSSSPSTKTTKESIAEVNRRYKEYTENMSTFEIELESLLGEFHIKMKGLAGFARLCPGDQYEIFMRYGRQRWKLKGKIEVNSRQSWDGEEMVFMPLITDLINIKVTELKGLATHILVGSVICETKELFTAMPQVVAVDVNDLGTIKLNLEVTWFPFDVEDLSLSSGNVSKAAALQRRVSVYSQGTPETPTFQDTSFFSTLPDEVFEHGGCSVAECKRLSFNFSDTSASPPPLAPARPSTPGPSHHPAIMVTPPERRLRPPAPGRQQGSIAEETAHGGRRMAARPRGRCARRAGCPRWPRRNVFLHHAHQDLKPLELDEDEASGSSRQPAGEEADLRGHGAEDDGATGAGCRANRSRRPAQPDGGERPGELRLPQHVDFDDEDNGDDGAVLRTPPQRSPSLDMRAGACGQHPSQGTLERSPDGGHGSGQQRGREPLPHHRQRRKRTWM
ncbi:unnamed protein product [Arctogadus glacialis]